MLPVVEPEGPCVIDEPLPADPLFTVPLLVEPLFMEPLLVGPLFVVPLRLLSIGVPWVLLPCDVCAPCELTLPEFWDLKVTHINTPEVKKSAPNAPRDRPRLQKAVRSLKVCGVRQFQTVGAALHGTPDQALLCGSFLRHGVDVQTTQLRCGV